MEAHPRTPSSSSSSFDSCLAEDSDPTINAQDIGAATATGMVRALPMPGHGAGIKRQHGGQPGTVKPTHANAAMGATESAFDTAATFCALPGVFIADLVAPAIDADATAFGQRICHLCGTEESPRDDSDEASTEPLLDATTARKLAALYPPARYSSSCEGDVAALFARPNQRSVLLRVAAPTTGAHGGAPLPASCETCGEPFATQHRPGNVPTFAIASRAPAVPIGRTSSVDAEGGGSPVDGPAAVPTFGGDEGRSNVAADASAAAAAAAAARLAAGGEPLADAQVTAAAASAGLSDTAIDRLVSTPPAKRAAALAAALQADDASRRMHVCAAPARDAATRYLRELGDSSSPPGPVVVSVDYLRACAAAGTWLPHLPSAESEASAELSALTPSQRVRRLFAPPVPAASNSTRRSNATKGTKKTAAPASPEDATQLPSVVAFHEALMSALDAAKKGDLSAPLAVQATAVKKPTQTPAPLPDDRAGSLRGGEPGGHHAFGAPGAPLPLSCPAAAYPAGWLDAIAIVEAAAAARSVGGATSAAAGGVGGCHDAPTDPIAAVEVDLLLRAADAADARAAASELALQQQSASCADGVDATVPNAAAVAAPVDRRRRLLKAHRAVEGPAIAVAASDRLLVRDRRTRKIRRVAAATDDSDDPAVAPPMPEKRPAMPPQKGADPRERVLERCRADLRRVAAAAITCHANARIAAAAAAAADGGHSAMPPPADESSLPNPDDTASQSVTLT